jgi:hypothetical protein
MNFTAVSPTTAAIAGGAAFKGLPSQAKPAAVDFARPAGGIEVTSSPSTGTPPEVTAAREAAQQQQQPASPEIRESRQTTIFGEDLISEKSLDEVILSYLAEDLADLE